MDNEEEKQLIRDAIAAMVEERRSGSVPTLADAILKKIADKRNEQREADNGRRLSTQV